MPFFSWNIHVLGLVVSCFQFLVRRIGVLAHGTDVDQHRMVPIIVHTSEHELFSCEELASFSGGDHVVGKFVSHGICGI